MNNENNPKETRQALYYQTGENGEKIPVYNEDTPVEETTPTIIENITEDQKHAVTSITGTPNSEDIHEDKPKILYSLTDKNGNRLPVYDDENVVSEETTETKSDIAESSVNEQSVDIANLEIQKSNVSETEEIKVPEDNTLLTTTTPVDKTEITGDTVQKPSDIQVSQEVESAKTVVQTKENSEKKPGLGKKIVAMLAGVGLVAGGAVVAKNVVSNNGPANGEPVAEAPVVPGEDQNTSIAPETLKQLQQIKVSEAEAKTGINISEVKQKVDDPENTLGMITNREEGSEKQSQIDIFALEYKTLLSDDYESIQQLLELKQVTPERVVELNKWYSSNYSKTNELYNQEYIGTMNVNELYYALSGPVVTAKVAELLATNKISLPSSYEDKIDDRVSALISEYNGGDLGDFTDTVNKVVMLVPNSAGSGFDTESTITNIEDFSILYMPFTSKGTIGPREATYISGNSEIVAQEVGSFLGKHY